MTEVKVSDSDIDAVFGGFVGALGGKIVVHPEDDQRDRMRQIIKECPLVVFQELNKAFNRQGLMLIIDKR